MGGRRFSCVLTNQQISLFVASGKHFYVHDIAIAARIRIILMPFVSGNAVGRAPPDPQKHRKKENPNASSGYDGVGLWHLPALQGIRGLPLSS